MQSEKSTEKSSLQLTEDLNITDLLSFHASQSDETLKSSLRVEDLPDLRKSVPRLVPWSSVQSEVADSLHTALAVPVVDMFADAWKQYDAIRSDVKQSIASPQSRIESAVLHHEMTATLHPTVSVLVGKNSVYELVFDVTLTTVFQGLILVLQNGAITAIDWGTCDGSGEVAIKGIALGKRDLFKLTLPGRLNLKKPLAL
jgi:hypothetical protein